MTATDYSLANLDSDAEEAVSSVFLDLDTVLLAMHQGRRGLELGLQADLPEGIERLEQIADHVIVLVDPPPLEGYNGRETARRLETLREGLGPVLERLTLVSCPHGEKWTCHCGKPGAGLIDLAIEQHGARRRGGWHIGADQAGVQAGRSAGLKTIRIGPVGEDHLSSVHRADYEARDLLDAANRIMLESLTV
ncbi:MAG TPA: HAD hydrolase-like protein [Candidatus Limnocylindria bacterium]|nr:HAD hydrolase-like protein [Candidatus Limnocylindria bacterium]